MNQESFHMAGAGSGGGADTQERPHSLDGSYSVVAGQVEFIARPALPPQVPLIPVVSLVAADLFGVQGRVDVRGAQGVRITSGPPDLPEISPPTTSKSTNGIEMIASELQNITIQRGLIEGMDQKIEMAPGSTIIDGGIGPITIQSLTEITLSVAGGLASIKLTPAGIQIQGILVQIN